MPTNHDPAWLERLHETFVEALRSNDLTALGACYTETAILLPPGQAVVSGREAIVAYWQGAERIQDLVFEATDSKAFGDGALREAGHLLVTQRGQGRETFNVASKYVSTWLQVDGGWKLDRWPGAVPEDRAAAEAVAVAGKAVLAVALALAVAVAGVVARAAADARAPAAAGGQVVAAGVRPAAGGKVAAADARAAVVAELTDLRQEAPSRRDAEMIWAG